MTTRRAFLGAVALGACAGLPARVRAAGGPPSERWSTGVGSGVSLPVTNGKLIFVGDESGSVTGYAVADGSASWTTGIDSGVSTNGVVVHDGTLVVGTVGGDLYAVDAATGEIGWRRTLSAPVTGIDAADGVAYVATKSGHLVAVAVGDGRLRWDVNVSFPTQSDILTPTVAGSRIIFQSWDTCSAIRATDGEVVWERTVGEGNHHSNDGVAVVDGSILVSTAAEDSGYSTNTDATIARLSLDNGSTLWEATVANSGYPSPPVVSGDVVAVAHESVHTYDLGSGERRWKAGIDTSTVGAQNRITVADGTLYAAGYRRDGRRAFYALDADTGLVEWELDFGTAEYAEFSQPLVVGDTVALVDYESNTLHAYSLVPASTRTPRTPTPSTSVSSASGGKEEDERTGPDNPERSGRSDLFFEGDAMLDGRVDALDVTLWSALLSVVGVAYSWRRED